MMYDQSDGLLNVLKDATSAEAEQMLDRTRLRCLDELMAAGRSRSEGRMMLGEQLARLLPQGVSTPDHRFAWICTQDGERIGECWFGPFAASTTDWYIFDIEVDQDHRGRRVGRTALTEVAVFCRDAGARRLGLSVAIGNGRAIAAYRAAGFVVSAQDESAAEMWLVLSAV